MYRDVIVIVDGTEWIVRVETSVFSEITDTMAMRAAYKYMYGSEASDEEIAKHCRMAPSPCAVIDLDGEVRK